MSLSARSKIRPSRTSASPRISLRDTEPQLERRSTELIAAIRSRDIGKVEELIKAGANVNAVVQNWSNLNHKTTGPPLNWATQTGSEYTKLLLDAGAAVDLSFSGFRTALGDAVSVGDYETVRLLIEHGADVNAPGMRKSARSHRMPLEEVNTGDRESAAKAQLLRDSGATVNQSDINWSRTLVNSRGYERVKEAIDWGVDVNVVWGGRTALIGCIESLDFEGVNLLLDAGADLNLGVEGIDAPIVAAASSGSVKMVLRLLEAGVDLGAVRRSAQSTPLTVSTESSVMDVLKELDKGHFLRCLRSVRFQWELPEVFGDAADSNRSLLHLKGNLSQHMILVGTHHARNESSHDIDVEAITCGEYVLRNWGYYGTSLLNNIEMRLRGRELTWDIPCLNP